MKKIIIITVMATALMLNLNPVQAASLDAKIANDVKAATKVSKLPPAVAKNILNARNDKSPWLDQICSVDFPSIDTPICEGGDLTSSKLVVIYGDSHASMWMSALDVIGKKNKFKVRLFAKLACPIVQVPVWSYQLNRPFDECVQWQNKVLPQIKELKPQAIIVTDQWKPAVANGKISDFDTPFMWEREFPLALKNLSILSKNLIVIGNNPSLSQDPVSCISRPRANLALCAAGRTQADNARFNKIEAAAVKAVSGIYIDTVRWACTALLCPVVISNKLAYFDQWHFTESYVSHLSPALEEKLMLSRIGLSLKL
jgi:hypothetical protein